MTSRGVDEVCHPSPRLWISRVPGTPGGTVARGTAAGADAHAALRENDSYGFFRKSGGLLVTGPTGTNVADLVVVLLGGAELGDAVG